MITPPWLTGPAQSSDEKKVQEPPKWKPPPPLAIVPPQAPKKKLHSQSKERIARRTEENLTPKMKERRDRFIAEYLVDFNGPRAIIRAGGSYTTAEKISSQFLHEPYVLKKIRETIDLLEEKNIINRQRVLAMLVREANYTGQGASHGARVSAASKLASILGMDAPIKVEGKFAHGVMLVPMTSSKEDWEKLAQQSQAQLKEDVRK